MRIKQAVLRKTIYQLDQYEDYGIPEIGIVGRSNAGKSSLINCICNNGRLARVSQSPGKTRSINLYLINNGVCILADLPGYGYARRSVKERNDWKALIEGYFSVSQRLRYLFLLCDIRHEPSVGDGEMLEYLLYYRIPFSIVATKADKVAKSKRKNEARKLAETLHTEDSFPFSVSDKTGVTDVLVRIGDICEKEHLFYDVDFFVDK